jgi:hypothetical protein
MNPPTITQTIQTLDPDRDHQQICHLLAGYEFPWDMTRALELALLRTFCVPSIAKLLDRTGEFHHHGQKRYDDTGLIVSKLLQWGYEDHQGAAFLSRMNGMHGRYSISNADFCYVLSTFIYEPIRWCDRFTWRPLSEIEKQALFHFWRNVGLRMDIQEIPTSYGAFEQFNRNYEAMHFQYADPNKRVADATLQMFLNWFPSLVRPVLKPWASALLDEPMRSALGWPESPKVMKRAIALGLKSRSAIAHWFPDRRTPDFFADQRQRSHPKGYQLEDIGPPEMLADLNRLGDSTTLPPMPPTA